MHDFKGNKQEIENKLDLLRKDLHKKIEERGRGDQEVQYVSEKLDELIVFYLNMYHQCQEEDKEQ